MIFKKYIINSRIETKIDWLKSNEIYRCAANYTVMLVHRDRVTICQGFNICQVSSVFGVDGLHGLHFVVVIVAEGVDA